MIEFISSWASEVIVSVIIATILEIVLPEGNNKKYIKTVIGVYILFAIISPVISKFSNEEIKIENIFNLDSTLSQNTIEVDSINTTTSIEKTYITKLKQDITKNVEEKGYEVNDIEVKVETKDENNFGKIYEIILQISQTEKKQNNLAKINEIKIEVTNKNNQQKEDENKVSYNLLKELKEYLNKTYEVEIEKIKINE